MAWQPHRTTALRGSPETTDLADIVITGTKSRKPAAAPPPGRVKLPARKTEAVEGVAEVAEPAEAVEVARPTSRLDEIFALLTVADLRDPTPDPEGDAFPFGRFDHLRPIYGELAMLLFERGWATYPQERWGKRNPSKVDGRMVKWSTLRTLDRARTKEMSLQASMSNVALILGVQGVFALDVDCDDQALSWAVQACARRCLGGDGWTRYGRAPRALMLYRTLPGVDARSRPFRFAEADDVTKASSHALEILGHGGSFTAFGKHHETGSRFTWDFPCPQSARPEDVPLVTEDQLRYFLREVQTIRPFVKGTVAGSQCTRTDAADEVAYDPTVHGVLPRMRRDGIWTWDNGRVVDGRRAYCVVYSLRTVTANPNAWKAPDGGEALLREADKHLRATLAPNGKADEAALLREFRSIAKSDIANLKSGKLHASNLIRQPDGTLVKPGRLLDVTPRDPALDWLGQRDQSLGVVGKVGHSNKGVTVVKQEAATDAKREARKLRTDRAHATAAVRETTEEAIEGFVRDVFVETPSLRVLRAPTGGGKTVMTVTRMVQLHAETGGIHRATLIIQPTHRNVTEAVAVARTAGAEVHVPGQDEEEIARDVAELNAAGVRAVHWRSKVDAGCWKKAEVELLQEVGLGSDGLCRSKRARQPGDEGDEEFWDECVHFATCGFQKMKSEARRAQVIMGSHYWLTCDRLPQELQDVSGVVIDEGVTLQVLQASRIAASDLREPRDAHLSKAEWQAIKERLPGSKNKGRREDEREREIRRLLDARTRAVNLLDLAALRGLDPVRLFATSEGAVADAETAARVCGNSLDGDLLVAAWMDLEAIRNVADMRPDAAGAAVERRLWRTIVDGVRRFVTHAATRVDPEFIGPVLHGTWPDPAFVGPVWAGPGGLPFDTRLQPLAETDRKGKVTRYWRVSWRRETQWNDKPRLLLDATADQDLVRATFPHIPDERFSWHEVSTDLNLRAVLVHGLTFSPSSLVADEDAEDGEKKARELQVKALRIITMVAGAHGHGRTVACLPLKARAAVLGTVARLPTLDSMHFGATRGVDAAKGHLAFVGVGRTEWPIWLLDGMTASATWDRSPELPMDRLGTGLDASGNRVRRKSEGRLVRMRDGRDLYLPVPVASSEWGRRLDAQWRESEQTQFLGRSRPVHTTETKTYVHASSVFPEHLIWDEVLSPDEFLDRRGHEVWESIVVAQGVVDEVLTVPLMEKPAEGAKRVRDFARGYRMCSGFRTFAWTDRACVRHEGLIAAWQSDPRAALEALGAPKECLETLELGALREPLKPSVVLEDDKVSTEFAPQPEWILEMRTAEVIAIQDQRDVQEALARAQDEANADPAPPDIPEPKTLPPCSTSSSTSTQTDWTEELIDSLIMR